MISPISPISPVAVPETSSLAATPKTGGDFQSMLQSYIGGVQRSQDAAQHSVDTFLAGGSDELHSVAIAAQRAELEFEMFLQVRNKVVSAYQEVMKMQV